MFALQGCGFNPVCHIEDSVNDATSSFAGNAIDKLADSVSAAVADGLSSLGTMWVNIGTPNLTEGSSPTSTSGSLPPGSSGIDQVLSYLMYIGLSVCILSLMVAGARMAMPHRHNHGHEEEAARVGTILMATMLISGAAALVGGLFRGGRTGQAGETVAFLQNSLWFYVVALALVSVVASGMKMAWEQKSAPGRDLVRSLLTLILITGAGLPVLGLLVTASDAFSEWIISTSLDCGKADSNGSCFSSNIVDLISFGGAVGSPQTAPLMVIVLGLVALIASLIQIMLMVARAGMLVILAGILPLTAAATNTASGDAWFKRSVSWLIAWLLYKPAAAVVYATAFHLMGTKVFRDDGTGLISLLTGLMLMILALVALPALMRFVTPAVSALASSGGGSGAMLAAAALPAMGAVSAGGRGGGMSAGAEGATASTSGATGAANAAGGQGPGSPGWSGAGEGAGGGSHGAPSSGRGAQSGAGSTPSSSPTASPGATSSMAATGSSTGSIAAAAAPATAGASVAVSAAASTAKQIGQSIQQTADSATGAATTDKEHEG